MFGLVVRVFLILRRLLNRSARREAEILVLRQQLVVLNRKRPNTEAIRLERDLGRAFGRRGLAYSRKKESERAMADYDEAIRLNPSDGVAFNNRCWQRALKGQLDRAMPDCKNHFGFFPTIRWRSTAEASSISRWESSTSQSRTIPLH